MDTLVVYYSYSGKTENIAQELAAKESADIIEIKEKKRPSKLKAYTAGIIASIKGNSWPILPLDAEFAKYGKLVLLSPVWAGNPPPAFNAMMQQLPSGKAVSVIMVSASGKSDCKERLETMIKDKGSELESFEDIKVPR